MHLFVKILILATVFRLLLDYGYWKFVNPLYYYSGFAFDFNTSKLFVSWLVSVLILYLIYLKRKSALIYIYILIYATIVLPSSSYYALSGNSTSSYWCTVLVYVSILIFLSKNSKEYVSSNIKKKKEDIIIAIAILFCLINIIYLVYVTKGSYNLSFNDVYDYRSENAESYAGIFGYINNWSTKIFVPFLIAVNIVRKNKAGLILSILICILFYAFTGHKSTLLPIILCLFLSKAFNKDLRKDSFNKFFTLCFSGLIIFSSLGLVFFIINDDVIFASIFFRRTFFVPVFLNDIYFDMFETMYAPVYWSNSLLSSFINYPYGQTTITKVVGAYLNLPDMSGNTGFIGSGYMQAKYWGVFLYTTIIIVINYYLSKISHRVQPIIFNAVLLMPFLTIFSSSDLPTSILTHGVMLAICILYLYSGVLKFNRVK